MSDRLNSQNNLSEDIKQTLINNLGTKKHFLSGSSSGSSPGRSLENELLQLISNGADESNSDQEVVAINYNFASFQSFCLIQFGAGEDKKQVYFKIINDSGKIKLIDLSNGKKYFSNSMSGGVEVNAVEYEFSKRRPFSSSESNKDSQLLTPMPGKILNIFVQTGEKVKAGDKLYSMEAMKMEHTIKASADSEVKAIHSKVGEQVKAGESIVELLDTSELTK